MHHKVSKSNAFVYNDIHEHQFVEYVRDNASFFYATVFGMCNLEKIIKQITM